MATTVPFSQTSVDKSWRTIALKNTAMRQIEEAIMFCTCPLPENAAELENRAYLEAENKRDYRRIVERIIDEIDQKAVAALLEQQIELERIQGEQPRSSKQKQAKKVTPQQKLRRLKIRHARILKGRMLKGRALKHFRVDLLSFQSSSVEVLAALKRRRNSRFHLHKYLCSLIEAHYNETDHIGAAAETQEPSEGGSDSLLDEWKAKLVSFFAAIEQQENLLTVPLYLCDPVSFALFQDPVVAPPSGHTYERELLEYHIKRKGRFDPLTSIKLPSDPLVPNVAIKKFVDFFLEENEWAQWE